MNQSAVYSDPGVEMALRLRWACEAHETSIASHLDRVSRYACDLGRLMGLSEDQLADLHHATALHRPSDPASTVRATHDVSQEGFVRG